MDPTTLLSLAGSLARAGLPALSSILGAVVPPPYDLLVKPTFSAVAWALGVDPTIANAPAAVQAKIDADPATAAQQLQYVEEAHADAAAELQAYLADVANARSTSVTLAQIGTWPATLLAAAPAILGVFNCCLFVMVAWFLFTGHNIDSPNGNLIVGTIIGAFATTQAYFGGSSAIAKHRGDQAIDFAHQAVPTAPAAKRAGR